MQLLWRLHRISCHGENVQAGVGPYHVTLVARVVVTCPRASARAVGELVRSALTCLIACPVFRCAGDGILESGIHVRCIVILVVLHARGIASSRGCAPNGSDHAGHCRLRGKGATRTGEGRRCVRLQCCGRVARGLRGWGQGGGRSGKGRRGNGGPGRAYRGRGRAARQDAPKRHQVVLRNQEENTEGRKPKKGSARHIEATVTARPRATLMQTCQLRGDVVDTGICGGAEASTEGVRLPGGRLAGEAEQVEIPVGQMRVAESTAAAAGEASGGALLPPGLSARSCRRCERRILAHQ